MKRLAVLIIVLLALTSTGALFFFFKENGTLRKEKSLVEQIKKEIQLPQSFWERTSIQFFWMEPYTDFLSEKEGVRAGMVIWDWEAKKDIIHINKYLFTFSKYTKYNNLERFSLLREVLAHEAGHVLSSMAIEKETYKLKQKFWRELGGKFEARCVEYFRIVRCFSNSWEYRKEEVFADIARMIICPSCNQKPETAVTVTPRLKDLVKQIIDIALD